MERVIVDNRDTALKISGALKPLQRVLEIRQRHANPPEMRMKPTKRAF